MKLTAISRLGGSSRHTSHRANPEDPRPDWLPGPVSERTCSRLRTQRPTTSEGPRLSFTRS